MRRNGTWIYDAVSLLTNFSTSGGSLRSCEIVNQNCTSENIGLRYTSAQYVYIGISVLGILGNGLAIAVIMRSREMRETPTNMLIINQSLIDLCTAVVGVLMMVVGNGYAHLDGVTRRMVCYFWVSDYPFWSLLTSSSYSLVILSLERYVAIHKPIYHRFYMTHTRVILFGMTAWIIGPLIQLGLLLPTTTVDADGCCSDWDNFPNQKNRIAYGLCEFFFTFLLPFSVVTYCSATIYQRVKPGAVGDKRTLEARRHSSLGGPASGAAKRNGVGRRNLLGTLFSVVVAFAVCNCPRSLTYVAYNVGDRCWFSISYFHWATCCTYSNCCVNPFVYTAQYKAYKQELRSWFWGDSVVAARRKRVVASFRLSVST